MIELANEVCAARIVPEHGGRVAGLVDRTSGRELLFQRTPADGPRVDYLEASAGGWEEMFPNDSPHDGYPFHGVLWDRGFDVEAASETSAVLRSTFDRPAVDMRYTFDLLPTPRRGLRLTIELLAHADTGWFLWASHPMLAVEPGWRIDAAGAVEIDTEMCGRFAAGPLSEAERDTALTLVDTPAPFGEVSYLPATGEAAVRSPDGRRGTAVGWDRDWLRWLWLVTIANDLGIDLTLLIEPCTTAPYRLDEAIERGEAMRLQPGELRSWSVWVESLDA